MLTVHKLTNKEQTGSEMYDLVDKYAGDLKYFNYQGVPLSRLPLRQFYGLIKNVPFKKDLNGIEVVSRPFHILDAPFKGWDCKKKGIVIASYLKNRNIPYRFVASSRRPDKHIHHVYPEAYIDGQWCPVDATYTRNELFEPVQWTKTEILPDVDGPETLSDSPLLVSMYGDSDPSDDMRKEFFYNARRLCPETMGSVAGAIIAGAAAVTAAVVGAVAGKHQQQREFDQQLALMREGEKIRAEEIDAGQQMQSEQIAQFMDIGKKYLLPSGIALSLLLLAR